MFNERRRQKINNDRRNVRPIEESKEEKRNLIQLFRMWPRANMTPSIRHENMYTKMNVRRGLKWIRYHREEVLFIQMNAIEVDFHTNSHSCEHTWLRYTMDARVVVLWRPRCALWMKNDDNGDDVVVVGSDSTLPTTTWMNERSAHKGSKRNRNSSPVDKKKEKKNKL